MEIQTLLDDFNFYRSHTNHYQRLCAEKPYIKLPRLNKERGKLLTEMVAWCRSNELDPRYWLYCLFARGRWLFAPKWIPGALMSETALKWYRNPSRRTDDRLYRERIAQTKEIQQHHAGTSPIYDPNLHLSAEVEARKQRLLQRGDSAMCLETMSDSQYPTLGWHPQSKVCPKCALVEACKQKLRVLYPFDSVALREGTITIEQARLAAVVSHGRS